MNYTSRDEEKLVQYVSNLACSASFRLIIRFGGLCRLWALDAVGTQLVYGGLAGGRSQK